MQNLYNDKQQHSHLPLVTVVVYSERFGNVVGFHSGQGVELFRIFLNVFFYPSAGMAHISVQQI